MNRAALPLVLILALLAPGAAASSFTLGAERHMDQTAAAGGVTVYAMPVTINRDGFVYAKLLSTDGNAVNDGYHANGSIVAHTGWRLAFAWIGSDNARTELGEVVDGTPTRDFPVAAGATGQLVFTLRWPADAQTVGGADQTVWAALAYREFSGGTGPGATSGVQMDEARAISLNLHFPEGIATAPSGQNVPPPTPTPVASTPSTSGTTGVTPKAPTPSASSSPEGSGATLGGGTSGSGSSATGGSGAGATGAAGSGAIPPVSAIQTGTSGGTTRIVVEVPVPTWFLVTMTILAALGVAVLALVGGAMVLMAKRQVPGVRVRRVVRIPIRHSDADAPNAAAPPEGRER